MWRLMLIPKWARFAIAGVLAVVVVGGGMLVVSEVTAPTASLVGGPGTPDSPSGAGDGAAASVAPDATASAVSSGSAAPGDSTVILNEIPAEVASEIPKNSAPVLDVPEAQRAPRLPLPDASKQHDFAPATVDLTKQAFVYATTPMTLEELDAHLVKAFPAAGWKFANRTASDTDYSYDVLSPDGLKGKLVVSATPEGVPGHRSQVTGVLTRPSVVMMPAPPSASPSMSPSP